MMVSMRSYRQAWWTFGPLAHSVVMLLIVSSGIPLQGRAQAMGMATETIEPVLRQNNTLDVRIDLDVTNIPLSRVLDEIARKSGVKVAYASGLLTHEPRVTLQVTQTPVRDVLARILKGTNIEMVTVEGKLALVEKTASQKEVGNVLGRVLDSATRNGVKGATVTVEGTRFSALTDDQGRFSLNNVPAGTYTIAIKRVGYRSGNTRVEVKAGETHRATVVLVVSSTTLSEVVTTATGLQRRVEVGHDIATINADSLLRTAPIRTVSDLLAVARVPGVTVEPTSGLPGAPSRIRIRGIGSIMGDNDPVVFVDGMRISASTSGNKMLSGTDNKTIVTSRLDDIDPEIIETIEVLRGPSAGALYGTDAANGVILITTKKGTAGPARWTFMATHDWNELSSQRPPIYTGWGRGAAGEAAIVCGINDVIARVCVQDSVSRFTPENEPLLTSEARGATTVYSASMNGGAQQFRYNMTASYKDVLGPTKMRGIDQIRYRQAGVPVPQWLVRPDGLETTNLTANITMDPGKGFDVGLNMQFIQQGRARNKGSVQFLAVDNIDTTGIRSPFTERYTENLSRVVLGAQSNWNRWSWLTGAANAGVDRSTTTETRVAEAVACNVDTGCQFPLRNRQEGRGSETILSFNLRGGIPNLGSARLSRWISLQPTFGMNVTQTLRDRVELQVDTAQGDGAGTASLWAGSANALGDSMRSATAGLYADLRIGVLQRLYTSIGLRRDVGSSFGKKSGLQNYPKLNTSWLVSDESFFPKSLPVNTLRLRFAAGMSGVQPVLGAVDGGYLVGQSLVNGQLISSIQPNIVANPRLKAERGVEIEYGLDIEALDQRLAMGVTIAEKNSRNVITQQVLPPSVLGIPIRRYDNIGHVVNRTIELSLDSRVIDRAGFLWTVQTGASTQINRVVNVGAMLDVNYLGSAVRVVEGYPIGGRWERPVLGYFDTNGDGLLSASEIIQGDSVTYVGWAQPKYSVSYGTSISAFHRRVTITTNLAQDVGITQSIGNSYYGTPNYGERIPGLQDVTASLAEQAVARGCVLMTACAGGKSMSQTFSMLRWTAASLSVDVPSGLARAVRARSMAVQITGRNLGVWTRYRGRDPSVNGNLGEAREDPGDIVPPPQTFSMAVRFGF